MGRWRGLTFGIAIVSIMAGMACHGGGGDETAAPTPDTSKGPVYTPTGNEGSITGVVAFKGVAPEARKIQMGSDPVCEQKGQGASFEDVIVHDGKLQNVFVYVKSGLPQNSFQTPAAEAVLDQNGCRYVPHVLGVQTNQAVKILNSDNTSHNVHPVPQKNREWNENQYPSAPAIMKRFSEPEVLIPVKCNQHSWMKAYVGVLPHPFFAVTGADGSFTLKGLPPGDYEVEAWHEKLGAKTARVTVKEKAGADAPFEFSAASAAVSGALKIKPALVLP